MDKVLIVTGGGRGIGAAIARDAAQEGYDVCINYLEQRERAEAVVRDIVSTGRRAIAVRADVSHETEVLRLFATVDHELGTLSALVNNAGALTSYGMVADLGDAELRRNFEINVIGPILCAREALRRMCRSRGGKGGGIVNIASRAATMGMPNEYVQYAAAKGAIISFTTGLSREVVADGVRVNSVSPGLIDTEMQTADRLRRLAPTVPIGRAGHPKDVAAAVLWLLSEQASYVTGADILVAGGR